MSKMKSVLPDPKSVGLRKWHFESLYFAETYPGLYEFLATGVRDNEPRKGGSINLFAHNGSLKVCFTDKETQMAFYAVLNAAEPLIEQLEGILAGEHDPWSKVKGAMPPAPF